MRTEMKRSQALLSAAAAPGIQLARRVEEAEAAAAAWRGAAAAAAEREEALRAEVGALLRGRAALDAQVAIALERAATGRRSSQGGRMVA